MHSCLHRLLTFVLAALFLFVSAGRPGEEPTADPDTVGRELDRIEDMRILHRFAIQALHDARALALYLKGWDGPDRDAEVESLFVEAEGLYGRLRGPDHGGMALQARLDAAEVSDPPAAQLALVQRARRTVAPEVLGHYRRSAALRDDLADAVRTAARAQTTWTVTDEPLPWPDPETERARAAGLRFGWDLRAGWFDLPEGTRNRLLARGARTGVTTVNVSLDPIANWANLEPEPGTYDFAALDALAERLARHGMTVAPMLKTLTGAPPGWHVATYGDICRYPHPARNRRERKAADEDGLVRRGINLFHEPTREAFARFLAAYGAHLKSMGADRVAAVYIDGGLHEIHAVEGVAKALETYWADHGEAETGAPWRSPETLREAETPDPERIARAERVREEWLLEYVRRVREPLQAAWPGLPVQTQTVSDDFHRLFAYRTGRSRDLHALARATRDPGTATDSPASFLLLKSLADGRRLWSQGIHDGCGTCGGAAVAQTPWFDSTRILMGSYDRTLRFRFPRSWFRYPDGRMGGFGIGDYYLTPYRCQQFAPLLLNTRMAAAEVVILWSQSSRRHDPDRAFYKSALAWGHLLHRAFVPFRYIAEEQIRSGDLSRYRLLILPNAQYLPDDVVRRIRDWTEGGGTLWGFGAPGRFTETGAPADASPLAEVFGATLARMRVPGPVRPDQLQTTHPEGSFQDRNTPPRSYKFARDVTAALEPTTGKPRAWFAGVDEEVAIVTHAFGKGQALWCGFPLGYEYWEAAPYEMAFGITHFRQQAWNFEQNRYERWAARELEAAGIARPVTIPRGRLLRSQRGDDPDWFHILRNSPTYQEYIFEVDEPVRSVQAFLRTREGTESYVVGLANTVGNFMWERGYFVSTLAGGEVDVELNLPALGPSEAEAEDAAAPVVYHARLSAPAPLFRDRKTKRLRFRTWIPDAQSDAFVVAPTGQVRLYGEAAPDAEGPDTVAERVAGYVDGEGMAPVELHRPDAVLAHLDRLSEKDILIGCGDRRFLPVAEEVAAWLRTTYGVEVRISSAGPRATCRKSYMAGFGWTRPGENPVDPDILIGNAQENPLLFDYLLLKRDIRWLPLEINRDFPGVDGALVTLSCPIITGSDGQPGGRPAEPVLVLGATFPAGVRAGLEALRDLQAKGGTQ